MADILMSPGRLADQIPGISGSRCLADNLSDLRAQVPLASVLHRHSSHACCCPRPHGVMEDD